MSVRQLRRNFLAASIVALLPLNGFAATIFEETFDAIPIIPPPMDPPFTHPCTTSPLPSSAFPSGWLRRNVDNLTPAASVSYVNEAWIVRGDFSFNAADCAAFSTSWYTPAGTANDWIWTPLIALPAAPAADLSWNAVTYDPSYPDGYEVRVMSASNGPPTGGTGAIGNQITGSTSVFSVAPENSTWTARTASLAPYVGQSIYIGFRNNSSDKFLLLIDDIKVSTQATDVSPTQALNPSIYTKIPASLGGLSPNVGLTANNIGTGAVSNVSAAAQWLRNGTPALTSVNSDVIASLAQGANTPMVFPTNLSTVTGLGAWSIRYDIAASPADQVIENNQVTTGTTEITLGELARHGGASNGAIGIGANTGGELGVQFTISQPLTVLGIRLELDAKNAMDSPSWAGLPIQARLRNIVAGAPDAFSGTGIATTVSAPAINPAASYELPFTSPVLLAAGTYVMAAIEPAGVDNSLPLFTHADRFQTGTTWFNWVASPFAPNWSNFEALGAAYARTPAITLITDFRMFADGFENPTASRAAAGLPHAVVTPLDKPTGSTTQRSTNKPLLFSLPGRN